MKRPLLIILGIIVVLILLGIWVYMLLTGSTNNTDQFTDFGFGDTTDTTVQPVEPEGDSPLVNISSSDPLRQLTTKPVAGFTEVTVDASSTPRVQYVESGTGHIFSIDLITGEEERVSATTIPLTRNAVLTPDGVHVLLQAGEGVNTEFIMGTLSSTSNELSNFAIADPIISFYATVDNRFLYASPTGNNTTVKVYDPKTNTTTTLFTIPFREVNIDWSKNTAGPHTVYPKSASRLEGFVYSYTDGIISRLPISGYGLSAAGSADSVIYSNVLSTGEYVSSNYDRTANTNTQLPITVIPEKCAFSPVDTAQAICATTLTEFSSQMPDEWYRGTLRTSDGLWRINTDVDSVATILDISAARQQAIDVINPTFNLDGNNYYFQNRIDRTLWMYDLTL